MSPKSSASRKRVAPFAGPLLDLMLRTDMATWTPWLSFVKAKDGLGHLMTDDELALYQKHTQRATPPTQKVDECAMMVGTGAGKTRLAALCGVHACLAHDAATVADGELVLVPLFAKSVSQARNAFGYAAGFAESREVKPYVSRILSNAIEFKTGARLEIMPASFRSVRGFTNPFVIADEIAYWLDEGSNPDVEIVNALRTRLARVPGSQLLILSSPHAPRGVLHDLHTGYFGKDVESERDRVLFWCASTLAMRPNHPKPHVIDRAFRLDPAGAVAEYGHGDYVQFRQHQRALFDLEPVTAAIVKGRREVPPETRTKYHCFIDAAEGARSGDSMTLAIAHNADGKAVLDAIRVIEPPFSPADVIVTDFVPVMKAYNVAKVVGDRHAHGFVSAALRACGITFEPSKLSKSDLYVGLLALLNSGGAELLDVSELRIQLLALQRRSTSGRDSVDHPAGGHDDAANAAAGALVLASGVVGKKHRLLFGVEGDGANHIGAGPAGIDSLIAQTKQRLEAEAEREWETARASESAPMRGSVLFRVHGHNT
jgi:hypothetical protein